MPRQTGRKTQIISKPASATSTQGGKMMGKTMLAILAYDNDRDGAPEIHFVPEGNVERLAELLLKLVPYYKVQVWRVNTDTGEKKIVAQPHLGQ